MSDHQDHAGCLCCNVSRRQFVATAACAAGSAALLGQTGVAYAQTPSGTKKTTVRVFFSLHAPVQPGADWPNVGFDFQPVMKEYMDAIRKASPDIEFVEAMSNGPDETKKILEKDGDSVQGYIVFQMNCWNRVVQSVAETGKPTLYADFLYAGSGGFLVYTSAFIRNKTENLAFISSSDFQDIVDATKCFSMISQGKSAKDFATAVGKLRVDRTKPYDKSLVAKPDTKLDCLSTEELLKELKTKKLIAIGGRPGRFGEMVKESLGIEVIELPFSELNAAWESADKDEAQKIADRWKKEAGSVHDITDAELLNSAKMYLGEKALIDKYNAMGLTLNCLGGFYGGHIHAYPCVGFYELNREGLVGGCECDVRSAITMLVGTVLTKGRSGYISDPVMDIATRQIIYAHCVAPDRFFGPKEETNPFDIMTHSEDRKGASIRSIAPVGYMTTTIELAPDKKQILFHQAVAVGNSLEDRACRTKIQAEVPGDFEKLYSEWDSYGWHRVTFYGDLKKQIFDLADALGWKVLEEA